MDILGIGPLELLFVILIAIIVLGPRDLARVARSAGRFLNRVYRSEIWGTVTRASRDIRNLPNRLAREAALEELDETLRKGTGAAASAEQANQAVDRELGAWQPARDQSESDSPQGSGNESAGGASSEA